MTQHVRTTQPATTRPIVVSVPDPEWAAGIGEPPEGVTVCVWDVASAPAGPVLQAEFVVMAYLGSATSLALTRDLPRLRYVQTLTAGYDGIIEQLPPAVGLCNAAGVHDASTAELAVALMLAAQRGIGIAARDQVSGGWHPVMRPALADSRVLLVGAGGVGAAIATRLAGFEVELTRVASRARTDAAGSVHGVRDLPALLAQADIVVLACPLTETTRALMDAPMLARMRDNALLVNVSRGPVVVTEALADEVCSGRLRAAVDVIDPEPLPADHRLRHAAGFLITPHVGGNTSAFPPRALRLLRDQLRRLAAGKQPAAIVHPGSPPP